MGNFSTGKRVRPAVVRSNHCVQRSVAWSDPTTAYRKEPCGQIQPPHVDETRVVKSNHDTNKIIVVRSNHRAQHKKAPAVVRSNSRPSNHKSEPVQSDPTIDRTRRAQIQPPHARKGTIVKSNRRTQEKPAVVKSNHLARERAGVVRSNHLPRERDSPWSDPTTVRKKGPTIVKSNHRTQKKPAVVRSNHLPRERDSPWSDPTTARKKGPTIVKSNHPAQEKPAVVRSNHLVRERAGVVGSNHRL
ncbi:hypothetical protein B0H11DRAFT_1923385 [Mycena galericulata]|nr:hypothetical protein B0H11DRAFT_1923385 [Mycena galericulata]